MEVARFSCPNCGTVLQTAQPQTAGKAVKCPNCDFAVSDAGAEKPAEASVRNDGAYGERAAATKTTDSTALILVLVIFACVALLGGGGAFLIWFTNDPREPKVLFKPEGLEEPKPVRASGGPTPREPPAPRDPIEVKPDDP